MSAESLGERVEILSLKESADERARFIRDAGDLVRCLTIEFEIELGFGAAVVPVGKTFELAPSQAPLRERGAPHGDAHARRLPRDASFLWDRLRRGDDALGDETQSAFVLAREDENRVACGDELATIHRLLRAERERLRSRIANLSFDHEHRAALASRRLVRRLLMRRKVSDRPPRGGQTLASFGFISSFIILPSDSSWLARLASDRT